MFKLKPSQVHDYREMVYGDTTPHEHENSCAQNCDPQYQVLVAESNDQTEKAFRIQVRTSEANWSSCALCNANAQASIDWVDTLVWDLRTNEK